MMKTDVLRMMSQAMLDAEDKGGIAAPLSALGSTLNDMYTKGAKIAMEKPTNDKAVVFSEVDADLFVVSMAVNAIFMKAWHDSKSLEQMKTTLSELIIELADDIDRQNSDHEEMRLKMAMES